jgi:phage terminase small subunit
MKKTTREPTVKLTLKQKLFCDWYIKLANGTQAAIRAGYSEKTAAKIASENLIKPDIKTYIKKRMTELEDLLGFNKSTIIQDLHEIKARSMQAKPVMYYDPKKKEYVQKMEMNDEGEEVGVYQYDSLGAVRAIDTINKMTGYYAPEKVEDVTPLERKAPTTVVVNKTYADKESDQPTS